MTILKTILITGALVATATAAVAGPIDNRQARQGQRIYQGVQSGRLTYGETVQLVQGQTRIQAMKMRARADGFVDPWERARINAAQDWQSLNIWVKKHN
ncbi:hypothetical protein PQJ75_29610 [Rhodoplanes sp. TEM]|uniref:Antifreeze protein n=1 Tax=Rhodoplanes tepidamans TaxID=200616 RepID=A0ABT5JIZ7_RHOTP|nr:MULTISPECIES: hypothetical protein [Rhodoplanes]MDC7789684.1 hypothetical protein [Rhodoplanes tepidamans]MDC7987911.1 hypothetical protein [Rhodoplanes sp. TEM]MDQ0359200.1 uncharacterized membrane protein YebE (DUF533 family) [Rhodoplanes tepidamans]